MIGSHSSSFSSSGVGGESRIYTISDSYNSNLGQRRSSRPTLSTASESLEMMTTSASTITKATRQTTASTTMTASTSVPRSYSDVIPEELEGGGQLPGAILEEDLEYAFSTAAVGAPIVKQELASSEMGSDSRTSVFSDYLPCGLTRFHFSLCFGLVGFVIFWLGLLLRIYLPN